MESSFQLSRPEVRARAPRRVRVPGRRVAALPADWRKVAPPAGKGRGAGVAGLAGTVLVHLAVLALIVSAGRTPRGIEAQQPVEFEVVQVPPPPPPEPAKVEPPKPPEPPKVARVDRPRPAPRPVPRNAPPPPPDVPEGPPPPNDTPPPDAKPSAPIMIGMSLSSTTAAGSFAAPVGNTLYGEAPEAAPKPEDVQAYVAPAGRYVPPYKVTRLPSMKTEAKAVYPDEARRLGLEGQVVLRLTIDAEGRVTQAKVLRGAGHGFDEAAVEAIRRSRFAPAYEGADPVATELTYTYTFQLDF